MSNLAPFAPIRVSVEFALTDGNQVAKATYDIAPGKLPTEADIVKAAKFVMAQIRSQLSEEFWWQTRHGFLSDEMAERSGGVRFSIPGKDEWEADWAN